MFESKWRGVVLTVVALIYSDGMEEHDHFMLRVMQRVGICPEIGNHESCCSFVSREMSVLVCKHTQTSRETKEQQLS